MAVADHESLGISAWGARGVHLSGPTPVAWGEGEAGRAETVRLSGAWSGEGPPRLYIRAAIDGAGRSGARSLSVAVSEAAFRPAREGRLDSHNGLIVFEVN